MCVTPMFSERHNLLAGRQTRACHQDLQRHHGRQDETGVEQVIRLLIQPSVHIVSKHAMRLLILLTGKAPVRSEVFQVHFVIRF